EGGRRGAGNEARIWIVDPLDGTTNFIAGLPFWCVSVAAREKGEIVAGAVWDPLRGELYAAERGAGAYRNGERLRVTERADLDGSFLATGFPFRSEDRHGGGPQDAIRRRAQDQLDHAPVAVRSHRDEVRPRSDLRQDRLVRMARTADAGSRDPPIAQLLFRFRQANLSFPVVVLGGQDPDRQLEERPELGDEGQRLLRFR